MLQEVIEQAKALVASLETVQAQLESAGDETATPVAAAPVALVPPSAGDDENAPATAGPDNSLPFKCPACGATYEKQVICTNGHPAEQTLPTDQVLAGAPPADATATPAEPAAPSQAVVETSDTAAATAADPATVVASPTWPATAQ